MIDDLFYRLDGDGCFGARRHALYLVDAQTGEGDLRCNIEQAEQLYSALKVLGVPARLIRYPACASHGMSRGGPPDLRIHRLQQILDWWKRYLVRAKVERN